MNTLLEERISALFDDEVGAFEARRLTDELLGDPELQRRWGRYQLIGDALRNELPAQVSCDFVERVHVAIAREPALQAAPGGRRRPRWLKPLAGLAVAASVAGVAILTLRGMGPTAEAPLPAVPAVAESQPAETVPLPVTPSTPTPAVASAPVPAGPAVKPVKADAQAPAKAQAPAEAGGARVMRADQPLYDPRLESYLVNHAESAGQAGFLSRVRVIGFESDSSVEE